MQKNSGALELHCCLSTNKVKTFSERSGAIMTLLDLLADLQTLRHRREQLIRDFFNNITQPSNCIHHLLPPKRDTELTSRLYVIIMLSLSSEPKYEMPPSNLFYLANYQQFYFQIFYIVSAFVVSCRTFAYNVYLYSCFLSCVLHCTIQEISCKSNSKRVIYLLNCNCSLRRSVVSTCANTRK